MFFFPYPVSLILPPLGRLLTRLFGWRLEGQHVLLEIDETGDPSTYGKKVSGVIERLVRDVTTTSRTGSTPETEPYALIRLDAPLAYLGEELRWLLAGPRFYGHGLDRLVIIASEVNVHRVNGSDPPREVAYEDFIATAVLRLRRR
jgi:hypothetical protein